MNLNGLSVLRYVAASHSVPGEGGEGLQDGTVASASADVALSLLNSFTHREKCYYRYLFLYLTIIRKRANSAKNCFRSINAVLRIRIHRIHVFGPRGCGSSCQRYGSGSGSGSIRKNSKKNFDSYCFVTSF